MEGVVQSQQLIPLCKRCLDQFIFLLSLQLSIAPVFSSWCVSETSSVLSVFEFILNLLARKRVCAVHVSIESSVAPGKGMPAKWQMVCRNVAKSSSPSISRTPTWLPTLPCVYFPPRTHSAHYLLLAFRNLLQITFTSDCTAPSNCSNPQPKLKLFCFCVFTGRLCVIFYS